MVTLSVTRSRVAAVLTVAADDLATNGWHPEHRPILDAIDRAAGYTTTGCAAEDITLSAWDALVTYLNEQLVRDFETVPGRTQEQVVTALRGAASQQVGGAR